jgi:hypothetical protein
MVNFDAVFIDVLAIFPRCFTGMINSWLSKVFIIVCGLCRRVAFCRNTWEAKATKSLCADSLISNMLGITFGVIDHVKLRISQKEALSLNFTFRKFG